MPMIKISPKKINDPHFKDLTQISDEAFEVFSSKRRIQKNVLLQVGAAVYDLAKLRMLDFNYDFVDYCIDFSDLIFLSDIFKWIQIVRI
jgi:hypothetical protein